MSSVQLVYFSWVRERIGCAGETLALPHNPVPLSQILDQLANRGDGYADVLATRTQVRLAVNQSYVDANFLVHAGDEIAIFPPVTGG
jgi:molybdopterin synthase sulfur carrier subunit